jgi:heat-inducible transcriptional repressor
MELDDRKMRLLKAIVDDYIHTATPVASRALSKRHDFGLSSATIRNEMSDLEEMGYLEQRHTSAGRIPSEKAYRLYVDSLMCLPRLSPREINVMRSYYLERMGEIESVILQTARALSGMTDYTAVVLAPQYERITVRHVQLVPVSPGKALLVVVTDVGVVKDALLHVPEDFGAKEFERISRMLTEWLTNKPPSSAQDVLAALMREDMEQERAVFETVMGTIDASLRPSEQKDVVLNGANNIINYPEYKNPDKVKSFLSVLEHKEALYKVLSEATKVELNISIGAENPLEELKDCSIITATYRVGNTTYGSMGVIGPTRMNYAKAVAVLNHVGKSLTEILRAINEE